MKELIEIEDREGMQTVNARELHEVLEVQSRYNDWINNRIEKYGFQEDIDYLSFTKNLVKPQSGRPATEHHISISMAKELCMVENNDKGRQVRQYFISVEQAWNQPDVIMARALKMAHLKLESWKPKISAYDMFLSAENAQPMGVVAKLLGVGRNRLFKKLREARILMNDNIPYQEYMHYFEVIDKPVLIGDTVENKPTTLVKPNGVDYLMRRLNLV